MPAHIHRLYVGTYTDPSRQAGYPVSAERPVMGMTGPTGSGGVYAFDHDPETGDLALIGAMAVANASFLAFDRDEDRLFAVSELRDFQGQEQGGVASFTIDKSTGGFSLVNEVPSGGASPCHLVVSPDEDYLIVANWENARVAVLPLAADGTLMPPVFIHQDEGIDPSGERLPHAHFVAFDPDGNFLLATDTGNDRIAVYRLDSVTGGLVPNDPPWGEAHPGGGARHLAFHPNGRWLYANGEGDMTISVFYYDAGRGAMTQVQRASTIPDGVAGDLTTAQIEVHPNGRFVYVSNRGHSSIAVFAIHQTSGEVTRVADVPSGGVTPRNFAIDPSGRWMYVANQNTGNIVRFAIDPDTGLLEQTALEIQVPAPVCLLFTRQ